MNVDATVRTFGARESKPTATPTLALEAFTPACGVRTRGVQLTWSSLFPNRLRRSSEAAALSSARLRARFPMGPDGHELSFAKPAESTR